MVNADYQLGRSRITEETSPGRVCEGVSKVTEVGRPRDILNLQLECTCSHFFINKVAFLPA